DWLEVRADRVGDPDPGALREHFPGQILYTLRSRAEGGSFAGSREARRRRLAAAATGYDRVDLEGDRDLSPPLLAEVPAERRLISWHGPATDLAGLRARFNHLAETPAAFYKLVPKAVHPGEELVPLALLFDLGRPDVVAFGGGEAGFWTRLVAPRLGGPLVYGSATGVAAAPGQVPVARLRQDYGLPELRPVEKLCGVVGRPALGSLGPRLHNAAYRQLGIPALYVPFDVDHFGDFWLEVVEPELLERIGFPLAGLSVTTPHKDVAFAVAGATSPLALRLQAANTMIPRSGVWEGESTDAEGVVEALRARGVEPSGLTAAVVGCGGAGRAAALGLTLAGAEVVIFNRGEERGLAAARGLGLPFSPLAELDPGEFDLLVHATPLGRLPADELPIPVARLGEGTVVLDLVYLDRPTRLVTEARRRGAVAIDGREVLLHQAVGQFRAMTGAELPLDLGRRVLGLEATA
ncbi:MAG TPA: type I 3-dehydroquinate dehydratase, partial [Thermoanaerobaculia bacterium]|nr:type I 3-dehydroquinate dehydratase [Thermoanaerobaculia bacterium]